MTDLHDLSDHDRIDALAREAGSALRRAPSPDVLLRVHRAKRNRQVARATAGGLALVALVAGGIVLTVRDRSDELVPATVPPTPAPETTPPTSASATTVPDTRVTTLAPAPSTAPSPTAEPELLYLGSDDKTVEQVQRVVDLDTLAELRTEPLDDAAWRAYSGWQEPRTESTTGISYSLASYPGDDPTDGIPVVDWCGRFPLVVDGAPGGVTALPERASLVSVSDDGRWLLTIGAASCPVDGLIEPGMNVEQINYDQEVRLFDADDPSAPGRLLWTSPFPERQFNGVEWTSDGRWMAVTHVLETTAADGAAINANGLDVIETATGRLLPVDTPGCSIVSYGQGDEIFVGDVALALVTQCDFVVEQQVTAEVWALDASQSTAPLVAVIPGVPFDSFVTVEVWPGLTEPADATYLIAAHPNGAGDAPTRTFIGRGGDITELPVTDARVSFGPLPEIVGD